MALTLESLVLEVVRALAPLEQRLRAGEVSLLFAELGLPAPDTVLGTQRVSESIGAATDALAELPDVLSDLAGAIESGDAIEIARAGGRAVPVVQAVTAAIDAVAVEIDTAAEAAGPGRAEVEAFAAALAERLFGFALASYLERNRPVVGHLFTLFGIIEITAHAATPAAPAHVRHVFRFDRLAAVIDDPVDVLAQVYGWGTAEFDWDALLRRISIFLGRVSMFAFVQPGPPPFLRIIAVDIGVTDDPVPGIQAVLRIATAEGLNLTLPVSDSAALTAQADAALEAEAALKLLPPADLRVVPPTTEVRGKLRFGFEAPPAAGAPPIVVFGTAGGSRIEARTLRAAVGADLEWNVIERRAEGAFALAAALEGGKVVLSLAGADGFLAAILPSGAIEVDADLLVRWSSATGLHFDGEAGLRMTRALHRQLGPLRLDRLDVALVAASDALTGTVTITGAVTVGPIVATVDGVGTAAALRFKRGNLGPVDVGFRFVPPTGLGLVIDAAVVLGGGFLRFDPAQEEYAGMLELQIAERIAVKAMGLLTTRLPDGSKGYSLVLIIFVEGFAPIQLGFGFTLTGIGGLLGINRTFNEEALRAGLKNHTLDSVMFPQDLIRNAPQILSNLNQVFPPANGSYLFGPMVQIGWGTPALITADVGVVLEFGARLRLLILAQVLAILPRRDHDLVRLQMDAIGVLDFDQGTASLDATLYDSRLLQKFVLTGDIAMRLKWEGSPNFALAIGGLHPAFNPPLHFPKLERIALNLSAGDNPRLRCEAYFALTANTVQFGARAELYAAASGFSIQGDTGFDVLIQRDPFQFLAEFYAQLQLKRDSSTLFKVRVEGALTGPRPLHLKGKATFEVLWMDVSIRIDKTLVEGEPPPRPEPIDVLPRLQEALAHPGNWSARLPAGQRPMVTVRATPRAATEVWLHPLGTLTVTQTVVPLDLEISRFGSAAPAGARRFTISRARLGGQAQTAHPVRDFFAPAQFFEMSDEEKLSRPSFELMAAGVSIGAEAFTFSVEANDAREVEAIRYETWILDKQTKALRRSGPQEGDALSRPRLDQQARFGAAGASALRRTGRAKFRTSRIGHPLVKDGWSIVATDDLTVQPVPGIAAGAPTIYSEAAQALRQLKQHHPARAARLKILRLSEVRVPAD